MKFNPDIHKRKSIRLKWYDYSSEWLYFITICVKDKLCLFWEINDWNLELNNWWRLIQKYWLELENKYKHIKLHDFVIMPNHFHGIIELKNHIKKCNCKICRDTPCGYPINHVEKYNQNMVENYFNIDEKWNKQDTHKGCPYNRNLLWNIIWYLKSKTTVKYIKNVKENNFKPFNKKLWQKDYYEHIIRNEKSYLEIVNYIRNNPKNWDKDKFYISEI